MNARITPVPKKNTNSFIKKLFCCFPESKNEKPVVTAPLHLWGITEQINPDGTIRRHFSPELKANLREAFIRGNNHLSSTNKPNNCKFQ